MAGWVDSANLSRLAAQFKRAVKARSGDIRLFACLFVCCGIYLAIPAARRGRPLNITLGMASVIVGIGIWFFQKWARWLALAMFAVVSLLSLNNIRLGGSSLLDYDIIGILCCGYGFWLIWRAKRDKRDSTSPAAESESENKPLISLVALLREPRYLDARILAAAANRAWETNIPADDEVDDDAKSFIVGESPLFVIQDGECMFIVHNHDRPYFDEPEEVATKVLELRSQHAVREHKAWMAVDLMRGNDEDQPLPEGTGAADNPYRRIGRLLSELIDDDCLAVMYPDGGLLEPYSPDVHEKLTSDDPLAELRHMSHVPVIQIAPDDPRMEAAVEEARRRWPEFVAAFEERTPKQNFAVKAPISDGENTEFMWLAVTAIENDVIYGTLNNQPVALSRKYYDQRLTVPLSDLNDWMYTLKDDMHGGFTMKVLMEHYKEQQEEK